MRASWSAVALAVIVVACSSGDGNNPDGGGTPEDSGNGGDSTATDSGNVKDSSPGFDSTPGFDSSPGTDATSGGDAQNDATFEFDGFAKGDGSNCFDDDGDGWTTCDGDCNDHDSTINPCAFDTNDPNDPVGTDGIDNDCDGQIDNLRTCDGNLTAGHDTVAKDYALAMDICENAKCPIIVGATFYGPNDQYAHRVTNHMGSTFKPHRGTYMAFFSTGTADDDVDTPSYRTGDGTDLQNTFPNPAPLKGNQNPNLCNPNGGSDEPTTVNDYTELRLTLRAPINAGSFTFDFNFFSEEYPEYVCHGFNDTFLAMLTSQQYTTPTQIAFDSKGHRVNVNNGFLTDCTSIVTGDNLGYQHVCTGALSLLASTAYEIKYGQTAFTLGNDNKGSGATDWLNTTAPIQPGETFTLSFMIYDEGDGLMDSAINLDNFHWHSTTLSSPVTAR